MKHIIFIKVFYKYSNFPNNYIAEIQFKYIRIVSLSLQTTKLPITGYYHVPLGK